MLTKFLKIVHMYLIFQVRPILENLKNFLLETLESNIIGTANILKAV